MSQELPENEEFFPKGALAFFALMTAFFGSVWLALYELVLRQR